MTNKKKFSRIPERCAESSKRIVSGNAGKSSKPKTKEPTRTAYQNAVSLKKKFVFENGIFGKPKKSQGHDFAICNIRTSSPVATSQVLFKGMKKGGVVVKSDTSSGKSKKNHINVNLKKGSWVNYRRSSSDKTPAVQINAKKEKKIKCQKIHFPKCRRGTPGCVSMGGKCRNPCRKSSKKTTSGAVSRRQS